MPLRSYPGGRIGVPLVLAPGERSEARFDVIPAALVVERPANRRRDECASSPAPNTTVELTHQIVVQRYVQTHGHSLAHGSVRHRRSPVLATVPRTSRKRRLCGRRPRTDIGLIRLELGQGLASAPDTCQLAVTEYSPVTAIFTVIEPKAAKLKGKFLRSFQGQHAEQTRLQPGTSLWRAENMIPGHPGLGSHPREAYFGLEQPTTSAQAEKLYNIAIHNNKAECLQEYKVTTAWRAYVGRVAGGVGTQVLAEARRGQRLLKIPEMLRKGWVSTVGPCTPLPLA